MYQRFPFSVKYSLNLQNDVPKFLFSHTPFVLFRHLFRKFDSKKPNIIQNSQFEATNNKLYLITSTIFFRYISKQIECKSHPFSEVTIFRSNYFHKERNIYLIFI